MGGAPPFLYHPSEMAAIVSTGTGQAGPFPAVERVLGSTNGIDPSWYDELRLIVGRYGAGHVPRPLRSRHAELRRLLMKGESQPWT